MPRWRPLAVGVHNDRQLLQFCYTAEAVDSALKILDQAGLPGRSFACVRGWRWWRWWARALPVTCAHCHRFWQQLKGQPVEFTWQSEEGISLVAGAAKGPTKA